MNKPSFHTGTVEIKGGDKVAAKHNSRMQGGSREREEKKQTRRNNKQIKIQKHRNNGFLVKIII